MRWNDEDTLEFVKLYLKHECLWNPPNLGYKSKQHRDKAYSEICAEFKPIKNLTIPEVRLKIRTLRTTYIQQVNKIQQKSSPDCVYEPSLIWFHQMDRCLKDIIHTNGHSSYETNKASEADSTSCIWLNLDTRNELDDEQDDNFTDLLISNSDDDFNFSNAGSSTPIKVESLLCSKKTKKNRKLKRRFISTLNSRDSYFKKRNDEFDIYGNYIASQLREINLQKAMKLMFQIQSLVSETRMSDSE